MSTPKKASGFETCPTEIKEHIFGFVRLARDKSATRLVCHDWKQVSDPIFWRVLRTDARTENGRTLDALLRVLSHVRVLLMKSSYPKSRYAILTLEQIQGTWMPLLGMFGKNQLHKIHSQDDISIHMFKFILKSQSELRNIRCSVRDVGSSNPILGNELSELSELASSIKASIDFEVDFIGKNSSEYFQTMVSNLRRPRGLTLHQHKLDPSHYNIQDQQSTWTLQRMSLLGIYYNWPSNHIPRLFLLNCVVEMELFEIGCLPSMLGILTASFRCQAVSLRKLTLIYNTRWDNDNSTKYETAAVQEFLTSFQGLRELYVDAGLGPLLDISCLKSHASSLKSLGLGSTSRKGELYYTAETLRSILPYFQGLEILALTLPHIEIGKVCLTMVPEECISEPSSLPLEAREILEVVAKNSKIRAFRVLSKAFASFLPFSLVFHKGSSDLEREMMNEYANTVMNVLVSHGSRLHLLCFRTVLRFTLPETKSPDKFGHERAHYWYRRNYIFNENSGNSVMAQPLPIHVVKLEFPDIPLMYGRKTWYYEI